MSLLSVPAAVAADPAAKVVPSARAVEASPTPTNVLPRLVCVRMLPLPCVAPEAARSSRLGT